jgi:hypothetical protein
MIRNKIISKLLKSYPFIFKASEIVCYAIAIILWVISFMNLITFIVSKSLTIGVVTLVWILLGIYFWSLAKKWKKSGSNLQ